ncbi:putative hydroxymethylpyrimidine transport system substrate-binding protein [Cohaesibacter sp. ES.047]|uniref:ABC transporter substrate-binding protein n=1 Tax=Cohaesibacter sp. ES.047 TaxID=1798205 RepID=UPI000BB8900E|nr:ABC transporter substrate-binding protein [Cohaesibacter sp. ES.047]SNY90024.1 putative hydroxymethylpyrimidine transport system substrate-binding protein [Cohaesibacter sp. ES.047]
MKSIITALALAASLTTAVSAEESKFSIMLDWFVNPDHGPIIIAEQRGYFKDEGLDVEIIPPADPADPPKMAAAGQVDLGISYQPHLYLQHRNLPVVRVGTLVDSPLYCVMVDADGPIKSLSDLKGKRIGYSVPGIEQALMHRMLRTNGVDPADVEHITVNFALTSALASGRVEATSGAFRNIEIHQMASIGRKGKCFNPEDHGVPIYDELIYEASSKRTDFTDIRKFLKATARATADIKADPEGTWEQFKTYADELDDKLNHAAWFDTYPVFADDPITLDPKRYAEFGTYMKEIGLIDEVPEVDQIAIDLGAE